MCADTLHHKLTPVWNLVAKRLGVALQEILSKERSVIYTLAERVLSIAALESWPAWQEPEEGQKPMM